MKRVIFSLIFAIVAIPLFAGDVTTGMFIKLKFEDNLDDELDNCSGVGDFNGGAETYTTGQRGRAAKFNGDWAVELDLAGSNLTQTNSPAYTISFWMKSVDGTTEPAGTLFHGASSSSMDDYGLQFILNYNDNDDIIMDFYFPYGTKTGRAQAPGIIEELMTNWTYYTMVYTNGATKALLYTNGHLCFEDSDADYAFNFIAERMWVGRGRWSGEWSFALVDEVRFYTNGLTAAEALELYNYEISDAVPPTLEAGTTFTPADDATGVGLTPALTLVFNEPVEAGTGNIWVTNVTDGGAPVAIDVTSGNVLFSDDGLSVTVFVTSALTASKNYAVQMASGVIEDQAPTPNPFAGIADTTTYSFATGSDGATPTYTAVSPANGAEMALEQGYLKVTLAGDENAAVGAGVAYISNTTDGTAESIDISGATAIDSNVYIPFASMAAAGKSYTIGVTKGAIRDAAHNPLDAISTGWSYTTPASTPVDSGLVGFWNFDITVTGKVPAQGLTGDQEDVSLGGTAALTAFGTGLRGGRAGWLNGGTTIADKFQITAGTGFGGSAALEGLTSDFSVSVWVNNNGTQNSDNATIFFMKNNSLSTESKSAVLKIYGASTGSDAGKIEVHLMHAGGGETKWRTTDPAITNDSDWHNITFTVDTSGDVKIYIDGAEADVTLTQGSSGSGAIYTPDHFWQICHSTDIPGWDTYPGYVDALRVYNRVLSASDILYIYDPNSVAISSLTPADGTTGLDYNTTELVIEFSDTVKAGTGNIILSNLSDGTEDTIAVGSVTGLPGTTATIPVTFDPGKQYAVLYADGVFQKNSDSSDVTGIADTTTWNFATRTVPADYATADIYSGILGFWSFNTNADSGDTVAMDYAPNWYNYRLTLCDHGVLLTNGTLALGSNSLSLSTYVSGAVQAQNSGNTSVFENNAGGIKNAITLSAWVKPANVDSDMAVISKMGNGWTSYLIEIQSGGIVNFKIRHTGGDNIDVNSPSAISAGQWTHIVCTRDGANASMYINGTSVASTSSASVNDIDYWGNFNVSIGDRTSGGNNNPFEGEIEDVRIYNVAKSAAEAQAMYEYVAGYDTNTPTYTVDNDSTNKVVLTFSENMAVTNLMDTTSYKVSNNTAQTYLTIDSVTTNGLTVTLNLNASTPLILLSNYTVIVNNSGVPATALRDYAGNMVEQANASNTLTPQAGSPPTASAVAISGTLFVGQTLTGSYSFADADGDGDGASTFQWYRSSASNSGFSAITDATNTTYALTASDSNMYVKFEVTPVDDGATYGLARTGTAAESVAYGPVTVATPPSASNVAIEGVAGKGATLTGTYTYVSNDGGSEGTSTFRWLVSDTSNGTYSAISGATGTNYTVSASYVDKYIKFEVTPVGTVIAGGTAATSDAFGPIADDTPPTLVAPSLVGADYVNYGITFTYTIVEQDVNDTNISVVFYTKMTTETEWSLVSASNILSADGEAFATTGLVSNVYTNIWRPTTNDSLSNAYSLMIVVTSGGVSVSNETPMTIPTTELAKILSTTTGLTEQPVALNNPVMDENTPIIITKIPANANVRVYTVSGVLVKEMTAGDVGRVEWDQTGPDGAKVKAGLYIVYVSLPGAGKPKVVKVVVAR